jgi:hypothetical protein
MCSVEGKEENGFRTGDDSPASLETSAPSQHWTCTCGTCRSAVTPLHPAPGTPDQRPRKDLAESLTGIGGMSILRDHDAPSIKNHTQCPARYHTTPQHSTVQHSTAQHSTAYHSTTPPHHHTTTPNRTTLHHTVLYSTAQHSTAQQSIAQHTTLGCQSDMQKPIQCIQVHQAGPVVPQAGPPQRRLVGGFVAVTSMPPKESPVGALCQPERSRQQRHDGAKATQHPKQRAAPVNNQEPLRQMVRCSQEKQFCEPHGGGTMSLQNDDPIWHSV